MNPAPPGQPPNDGPPQRFPVLDDDGVVTAAAQSNPLHDLLGGRRGALESALPSVVFVISYLLSGSALAIGLAAALLAAAVLAAARMLRREKPVRVVGGLAAVALAAVVAARTGNAADYFLPSLLANVAAALIWAASILARWPLLGVTVGFALGQKTGWRRDPDLLRAYSRASWIWVGSFVIRVAVNTPLYLAGSLVGLGIARVVLGWPLVLLVIAFSWWVVRRTLPADHPGILTPRVSREE